MSFNDFLGPSIDMRFLGPPEDMSAQKPHVFCWTLDLMSFDGPEGSIKRHEYPNVLPGMREADHTLMSLEAALEAEFLSF